MIYVIATTAYPMYVQLRDADFNNSTVAAVMTAATAAAVVIAVLVAVASNIAGLE